MKTTLRDLKNYLEKLNEIELDEVIIKLEVNEYYAPLGRRLPATNYTILKTVRTVNTMTTKEYNDLAFENGILECVPMRELTCIHVLNKEIIK